MQLEVTVWQGGEDTQKAFDWGGRSSRLLTHTGRIGMQRTRLTSSENTQITLDIFCLFTQFWTPSYVTVSPIFNVCVRKPKVCLTNDLGPTFLNSIKLTVQLDCHTYIQPLDQTMQMCQAFQTQAQCPAPISVCMRWKNSGPSPPTGSL